MKKVILRRKGSGTYRAPSLSSARLSREQGLSSVGQRTTHNKRGKTVKQRKRRKNAKGRVRVSLSKPGASVAGISGRRAGARRSLGALRRGGRVGQFQARRVLRAAQKHVGMPIAYAAGMFAGNYASGYVGSMLPQNLSEPVRKGLGAAIGGVLGGHLLSAIPRLAKLNAGTMRRGVEGLGSAFTTVGWLGIFNQMLRGLLPADQATKLAEYSAVSGPGQTGVSLLNRDDLQRKVEGLREEQAQLESALSGIAGPLSGEQEAVYVSAAEHVASIEGPLRAAEGLLENGRMYEAGEAIKDAMSLAIVGRALLSGLTAAPAAAQQMPQQAAQAVQQQLDQMVQQGQLPETLQIQDVQSQQVVQVPAPAMQQAVEQVGYSATPAMNPATLLPWANMVAQLYGWAPSEVVTAAILQFLGNDERWFSFGPSPVVAMNHYAPTTSGYSNGSQGGYGLRITAGGQLYTVGGSPDEVLRSVSGILERHFGSY